MASGAGRAFDDGVWLAELGGLRDPGLLVDEVARSLGLSDRSARWAVASLADYLQARRVLLVLDQCEHLADACAVLADALLRGCPGLRILATTGMSWGWPARSRACPADDGPGHRWPERARAIASVRGGAVVRGTGRGGTAGFRGECDNGAAVAGVCRALDGIPLAVELAAVRLRSLSPEQILARLGSRFQLLSGGGPAACGRVTGHCGRRWSGVTNC